MAEGQSPPEGGELLPYLIEKGRFTEAMILAWQTVEEWVDMMVMAEYDLIYSPKGLDPRVDLVREVRSFPYKVNFLVDMGNLSEGDRKILLDFNTERNKLFHGFIYKTTHPVSTTEPERNRLLAMASKASVIASNRAFNIWTDERTGDTGNNGVPRRDRPTGAEFADKERNQRIIKTYIAGLDATSFADSDPSDGPT